MKISGGKARHTETALWLAISALVIVIGVHVELVQSRIYDRIPGLSFLEDVSPLPMLSSSGALGSLQMSLIGAGLIAWFAIRRARP